MRFLDEFRDPKRARALVARIEALLEAIRPARPLKIMEFCGGHTHTIFRYGLHQRLPKAVEWIHGPGCPVCILPREKIDTAVTLALDRGVILTCFGDVVRVPGSRGSLLESRGRGADVRIVYSPMDALKLAHEHPERDVVFLAIGFETTMPATALTVLQAARDGVENFSILCCHVTTPEILRVLLSDPTLQLDGIIAPGHVSTVLGADAFRFIPEAFGLPVVISGFEPLDLLQSLAMVLEQLQRSEAKVENQYRRVVRQAGNLKAQEAISAVFEPRPEAGPRGLGLLPASGVKLREAFHAFDA